MPDYETLLYEKRGRVGLITLNRPEKLNAWNPQMEAEFIDCVTRAAEDREVGALGVTGAGRAFCAGGDISGWSEEIASRGERRGRSPLLEREGSPEVPIVLRRGKAGGAPLKRPGGRHRPPHAPPPRRGGPGPRPFPRPHRPHHRGHRGEGARAHRPRRAPRFADGRGDGAG